MHWHGYNDLVNKIPNHSKLELTNQWNGKETNGLTCWNSWTLGEYDLNDNENFSISISSFESNLDAFDKDTSYFSKRNNVTI